MKRKQLSKKQSKKKFSRGNKVKNRNNRVAPMRGGYRL